MPRTASIPDWQKGRGTPKRREEIPPATPRAKEISEPWMRPATTPRVRALSSSDAAPTPTSSPAKELRPSSSASDLHAAPRALSTVGKVTLLSAQDSANALATQLEAAILAEKELDDPSTPTQSSRLARALFSTPSTPTASRPSSRSHSAAASSAHSLLLRTPSGSYRSTSTAATVPTPFTDRRAESACPPWGLTSIDHSSTSLLRATMAVHEDEVIDGDCPIKSCKGRRKGEKVLVHLAKYHGSVAGVDIDWVAAEKD